MTSTVSYVNRAMNTKPTISAKFSGCHQGGKTLIQLLKITVSQHCKYRSQKDTSNQLTCFASLFSLSSLMMLSFGVWLSGEHPGVVLWVLLTRQNQAVSDVKLPVFMYGSQGCLAGISQVAASTWWAIRYLRLLDFTTDKKSAIFHVTINPVKLYGLTYWPISHHEAV